MKEARVKVVLADLALTQLANRSVESLTTPEYRRLTIGIQLVRDPGMIYPIYSYLHTHYLHTHFNILILIYSMIHTYIIILT